MCVSDVLDKVSKRGKKGNMIVRATVHEAASVYREDKFQDNAVRKGGTWHK